MWVRVREGVRVLGVQPTGQEVAQASHARLTVRARFRDRDRVRVTGPEVAKASHAERSRRA